MRKDKKDDHVENEKPEAEEPKVEESKQEEQTSETVQEESEQPEQAMDVYSMLGVFIAMLAQNAWVWMGLRLDPVTGKVQRDLAQAHVAIDCLVFLADKMMPKVEEAQRRELRGIISDLQLNFVQQSAKGE